MDKPKIICIIGESGSGKSLIAGYIEQVYGYKPIESRTTRPPRTPDEDGHTFVTDAEFDMYKVADMIAFTEFGGYRYCCLKKDVNPKSIYVIDEHGYNYLKALFTDIYLIYSLRVHRDYKDRLMTAGRKRVVRDRGKFNMQDTEFDWNVYNEGGDIGVRLNSVDMFIQEKGLAV